MTDIEETQWGFRKEFWFLSNMYPCDIVLSETHGMVFHSSESMYQWCKLPLDKRETWWGKSIMTAPDGRLAKYLTKHPMFPKRHDWGSYKTMAMRVALVHKFEQHPDLRQKLIDTGDIRLVEYNNWNDKFWGVDVETGEGRNVLGEMLMKLRYQYAQEQHMEQFEE